MSAWMFWIGPVAGVALGIAGSAVGIGCSLRSARGPVERRAMVWWSIWFVGVALAQVAGATLLPDPWRHVLWLVYAPLLTQSILRCNAQLMRIRDLEAKGAST